MLYIRQVKHLARKLDFSVKELEQIAENAGRYCEELLLLNPGKPDKKRTVLSVQGKLRTAQYRLLHRALLPSLLPSECSHGGVRRRSIKTNFQVHAHSNFAFATDISNFYPSIPHNRVYRLFSETLKCSPDVSRLCTKICTYDYRLALGLVTSPLLADQIFKPIDQRINGACRSAKLIYSRFVDDITISGNFDLHDDNSGIARLISEIIAEHGFSVQLQKRHFGRLDEGFCITKLRKNHAGRLDVEKAYIERLEGELTDLLSLSKGESFRGSYFTRSQIRGRIEFVGWINFRRRKRLLAMYRKVDWDSADREARSKGLIAVKKQLVPTRS